MSVFGLALIPPYFHLFLLIGKRQKTNIFPLVQQMIDFRLMKS